MRKLFCFCLLFAIFFFIFSSYNYFLNFTEYSSPVSSPEQFMLHRFRDGVKGYFANVIKYCFTVFDMSGMPEAVNLGGIIEPVQKFLLSLFGAELETGASSNFPWTFEYKSKIGMLDTFLGAPGLFVFLPSCVYAVKRYFKTTLPSAPLQRRGSKILLAVFALSIIINILVFSRVMTFAGWNMRYLLTFAVIASPVIVYSYPSSRHKLCKVFLCLIMFVYLIVHPHVKPAAFILECLHTHKFAEVKVTDEEIGLNKYIAAKNPGRIALLYPQTGFSAYHIEKLRLHGVKIDKLLPEIIERYDLKSYDLIITVKKAVSSASVSAFEEHMKHPGKFASKCIYEDYEQNEIHSIYENRRPVLVKCDVPYSYLEKKGFIKDTEYKGEEFIILKKS